jgi:hypothetical protein
MTGSQPCVWVRTAWDSPSSTIDRKPNRCPICANRSTIMTDLPAPVIPNVVLPGGDNFDSALDMLLTSDLAKIEVRFTGSGDLLERFRIASKVSRHERELAEQ